MFADCAGHNIGVEAIHRGLIHAFQSFADPIQSSTVADLTFVMTHAETFRRDFSRQNLVVLRMVWERYRKRVEVVFFGGKPQQRGRIQP